MSSTKSIDRMYEADGGKNKVEGGTLYLVATPIGNLEDFTYRGVHILSEVDFIAAEDTRNTPKLLAHYGIKKPLVSYFEHNKRERGEAICERLLAGEACALVTDAGTPAISDPGEDLVRLCRDRGIPVCSVPGACAAITALTVSGLPTSRFAFEGFLSTSKAERYGRLESIAADERTLVFYEAPHKLRATLRDLYNALGDREAAFCRELTKLNEQVLSFTLGDACAYYETNEPRGEYVIVVSGADLSKRADAFWAEMDEGAHVSFYERQGLSRMDAIKAAAKDRGIAKNELYRKLIK